MARRKNERGDERGKDPWAAAYATEAALEEAQALLTRALETVREARRENWRRGRATSWPEAGNAAHLLELAQELNDFVHREGEYARVWVQPGTRPRRRARKDQA